MQLPFYTLDVFTEKRFSGNPLAVVLDADQLATEQMLAIARELNLSETVFVQKPANPAHTAKVRIFTPGAEIPFAGHPTAGAAVLLAELRAPDPSEDLDAIIALEENIGMRVSQAERERRHLRVDAPKLPEQSGLLPPLVSRGRGAAPRGTVSRISPDQICGRKQLRLHTVASLEPWRRRR